MDDKTYPYLKVSLDEKYPRLFMTRKVIRDGGRYYGPYTDVGAVRETLELLKRVFPLRTCRQKSVDRQPRPCLNYHIHRCLAPCSGKVETWQYSDMVKSVCQFLEGRQEDLIKSLSSEMAKAADNLEFEKAAALRDQAKALEKVIEKQKIVSPDLSDQDVLAMAREGEITCMVVFFVRAGKLMGREHFILEDTGGMDDKEILTPFVEQFYVQAQYVPQDILLPVPLDEAELIMAWLQRKRGSRVQLKVPRRGDKAQLMQMAVKNAAEELALHRAREDQAKARIEGALLGLKEYLELAAIPRRIECYDISNIQGTESVGSMVVFVDGKPSNDLYRRFKIKTVEGPNDFASMQEVIGRRFGRALKELEAIEAGKLEKAKAKFAELPSLVIVDGGKGQLNAAREVMRELGFDPIPTFGLAKEHEYLFSEGRPDPIILPRNSEGLYMMQRIRDEAHRFAITYHRSLRGKKSLKSILDDIPGVGPKRRKALVEHFRSMARLRAATVDEVASVTDIPRGVAEAVYEFFQQEEK
jgi:excinuclease ABC subunit C